MHVLDWTVLAAYFVAMVFVGVWARRRVRTPADFFTAGGRMPAWLAGISHHMSGYSAAVFVAYAAIAYTNGFALYVWWAVTIAIACTVCAFVFAPRWSRLRDRLHIVSPLEYLAVRFNVPTQQVMAWSGAVLKVFDVGAKWTASAVLLNVFAGVPLVWGILLTGGVTLIYATVGGLWADALTDFGQFLIQLVAGVVMFVIVLATLGGVSGLWTIWQKLPPEHSNLFNGQYSAWFFLAYCLISTVSYSGGTWNLAQRFIASPTGSAARRASLFSAALYLVWPLVLFFPMWAAPIILPHLADPTQSYALLATKLLPAGLIGLVLAGMFSHTMAMTSSDANAISAVVVRDIIPALTRRRDLKESRLELTAGRVATVLFIGLSMVIALTADSFGGVIGLLILWFGALVGPIAVPMLLGMLRPFRRCGPAAAILSWAAGLVTFALTKYVLASWIKTLGDASQAVTVAAPIVVSLLVFLGVGLVKPWHDTKADALLASLDTDTPPTEKETVTA
ncbi:sodium:solute symporter family protein [Fodinicola acaciae]|uniref:sodium:solute symporter family protein n=1 Tax=Fodinicola acaciae TaxID=2681555 RepID=UPI0013D55BF8|nr:sodium:solute symporter family protein [Fodinicola acaciae]